MSFRATPDASKAGVCRFPRRLASTIFSVLDRATSGASPKQLTNINDELFSKLNLTEPEEIWYKSFDGKTIEAWVQKPPDFDPRRSIR